MPAHVVMSEVTLFILEVMEALLLGWIIDAILHQYYQCYGHFVDVCSEALTILYTLERYICSIRRMQGSDDFQDLY